MSTSSSSSSQPDCVLLAVNANLGQLRDDTTASTTTSSHEKIEVSLSPAPPPLPSNLYVHCPELTLTVPPRIIRADEDLFLLRVAMDDGSWPENSDYFVYQARNKRLPLLKLLLRPHPFFHDDDVGLLSRGDNYTIAALVATAEPEFDLHVFHSDRPKWIYRKVSVTEPPRLFPLLIPENGSRLLDHETSTVISIGGEAGTMGWVDLLHSILLCDVLHDEPSLRCVPLPVPPDLVSCDNGLVTELCCPTAFRGIAVMKRSGDKPDHCLRLVHLESNPTLVSVNKNYEVEPGNISLPMHDWTIVSYTNTAMTSSSKDWCIDSRIKASNITIDSCIKSQLLQSELLGSASGQALVNLLVSHPAPAVSAAAHEGVVYLTARKQYQHPEAWVIAVDTENKTLLGAAEFGTENKHSASAIYCPSRIAKYIQPITGVLQRRMLGLFN